MKQAEEQVALARLVVDEYNLIGQNIASNPLINPIK